MKRLGLSKIIMTLLCVLFLVTSCGTRVEESKYRIGVSQCSNDYWREKTNEDFRRELLLHDNAELEIRMADADNERQISDIRYFIDNDFDLIIVSPNESKAIAPVVKEAMDKGIPVVTFDRTIEGEAFTAHIEVDNYALGEAVARYAPSVVNAPLRIIEIQGPLNASPARLRHDGFTDVVKKLGGAEVSESVYADWDGERAYRLTDSLLDLHPETNLIFAHTDHMAIRAANAAKEKGRKDIKVIGIDGFPPIGLQAVKDSVLSATFIYSTEGDRIIKTSLDILEGKAYQKVTKVPPLSPVDLSNADILLSQDSLLTKETEKITLLRGKLDEYWQKHSIQTWLLYAVILILLLSGGVVALLLKSLHSNRRHKEILEQKNTLLEEEKNKQKILYDQLQDVTRSKLTFFTNVSHDLRTPLALISGPIEELSNSADLPPRQKTLVKLAKKNISILRRLINQILDFRRYENGKTDLRLHEVDFPIQLKEWVDAFREVARQRDIKLNFINTLPSSFSLAVDVEKMERVFFNLMSNAFKHTADNGRITVELGGDDSQVIFSVRDTGSGIAAEECEKIFDRFYQVDEVSPKGSGIGLALTKSFIELHGGTITVESKLGEGSKFSVRLPIIHSDKRKEFSSKINASDINVELGVIELDEEKEFEEEKPMVLVIDDNRDIREMLGALLGDNYNILYAADGGQGIKKGVKYVPDLIICDVMMPGMDGMECVRRLKEEVSTSHIPVLMLTACSMEEQQREGYESGADGYLSKPFSNEVLKAQCKSLLLNRERIKDLYGKGERIIVEKKETHSLPLSGPGNVENDFYQRFLSLVKERLSDSSLSVEELAMSMGLSQSQLTRKIKALTNYTPVEIIRSCRLKKAKRRLETGDDNISEVAFGVGFSSLAYFSKCYKDAYGKSPSEVRRKNV